MTPEGLGKGPLLGEEQQRLCTSTKAQSDSPHTCMLCLPGTSLLGKRRLVILEYGQNWTGCKAGL